MSRNLGRLFTALSSHFWAANLTARIRRSIHRAKCMPPVRNEICLSFSSHPFKVGTVAAMLSRHPKDRGVDLHRRYWQPKSKAFSYNLKDWDPLLKELFLKVAPQPLVAPSPASYLGIAVSFRRI